MKKKIITLILVNLLIILTALQLDKKELENNPHTAFIAQVLPETTIAKAEVTPYQTPTPDPVILLFIWLTSGYDLQPESQYTSVNSPKTLYTSSGRSLLESILGGLFPSLTYTWYQSTDGQSWTQMKDKDKHLTVTPTDVGVVYYQQKVEWKSLLSLFNTTIYSQVASITTLEEPVNAEKLDVTADSNYLYNNQDQAVTTFVSGVPTPADATGDITWSVNDTSLATVDQHTGLVTANKNGKSGSVTVIGTLTNSNGSKVEGDVEIRIGGGLDDQTVNEGDKATFDILGDFDKKPAEIVWHKVVGKQDTIVSGSEMSYTTPATSYSDDGTRYYAVMTIDSGEGNKTTITTNHANLNVIKDDKPSVLIDNTVFNHSHNDHSNDNTVLNSVAKGDKLTYKINIIDVNEISIMASGVVGLKIPKTMEITDVRVDGKTIAGENVSLIADPEDALGSILIMSKIDFIAVKSHSLEVDGTVGDVESPRFISTVELVGLDNSGTEIATYTNGENMELNFENGSVTLTANDWQYQPINAVGTSVLIDRIEMAGNALDVSDNRRNKKPTKLYLAQTQAFQSGEHTLDSEMRYYQNNGNYETLDANGTLVSQTDDGDTVQSVSWDKNEGPLLYLLGGNTVPGMYSTTLEWSLVESL